MTDDLMGVTMLAMAAVVAGAFLTLMADPRNWSEAFSGLVDGLGRRIRGVRRR